MTVGLQGESPRLRPFVQEVVIHLSSAAEERGPLGGPGIQSPGRRDTSLRKHLGLSPAFSKQGPFCYSLTVAQVTAPMAFAHRLDAPELPDFSMLKRLARDQLIYLLEQVSACHGWLLYCVNSVALNVTSSLLSPLVFFFALSRQVQNGAVNRKNQSSNSCLRPGQRLNGLCATEKAQGNLKAPTSNTSDQRSRLVTTEFLKFCFPT